MPIALARRYRPRRFADLMVQDHVAAALRGAVAKDRVGHGYLLTGPRGVGKTTAARILAMALNCEHRGADGEPCGECASCRKIWNGSADLDVVEIDAASNRGVDDARDLRERAMYAASQAGHHKVYIVDEAHMLTREAWNVLLKILEEPPPGVVFVFATTEPQKIANTAAPVLSRLQRFDFRRIGPGAIYQRLRQVVDLEGLAAEDDALRLIARHADGGMRDALSVLDQCLSFGDGPLTAGRVRDVLGLMDDQAYAEVLAAVAARRPADIFPIMDRVADSGADLAEFAGGLAEAVRAVVMHHYGAEPEGLPESTRAMVLAASEGIAAEDGVRMLKVLADAETAIRRSANPRIALETLLLRWTMMDRAADLRALLAGEGGGDGGAAPEGAPRPSGGAGGSRPGRGAPAASGGGGAKPTLQTRARQGGGSEPARPAGGPPPEHDAAPPADDGAVALAALGGPLTDDALAAAWSDLVAAVAGRGKVVGQAIGHAVPRLDERGVVVLGFAAEHDFFRQGAERQLATIEAVVRSWAGRAVPVRTEPLQPADGAASARPQRLSADDARRQRLADLRHLDPALDAAADALDLELVDEN